MLLLELVVFELFLLNSFGFVFYFKLTGAVNAEFQLSIYLSIITLWACINLKRLHGSA